MQHHSCTHSWHLVHHSKCTTQWFGIKGNLHRARCTCKLPSFKDPSIVNWDTSDCSADITFEISSDVLRAAVAHCQTCFVFMFCFTNVLVQKRTLCDVWPGCVRAAMHCHSTNFMANMNGYLQNCPIDRVQTHYMVLFKWLQLPILHLLLISYHAVWSHIH